MPGTYDDIWHQQTARCIYLCSLELQRVLFTRGSASSSLTISDPTRSTRAVPRGTHIITSTCDRFRIWYHIGITVTGFPTPISLLLNVRNWLHAANIAIEVLRIPGSLIANPTVAMRFRIEYNARTAVG